MGECCSFPPSLMPRCSLLPLPPRPGAASVSTRMPEQLASQCKNLLAWRTRCASAVVHSSPVVPIHARPPTWLPSSCADECCNPVVLRHYRSCGVRNALTPPISSRDTKPFRSVSSSVNTSCHAMDGDVTPSMESAAGIRATLGTQRALLQRLRGRLTLV